MKCLSKVEQIVSLIMDAIYSCNNDACLVDKITNIIKDDQMSKSIGEKYIQHRVWGSKFIQIYNEPFRRWETKLEFRNNVDRNHFYDKLPKECKR